jgi:hypothetical protein
MTVYYNWQRAGFPPGVAPYNRLSPNLAALRDEVGKRFGGEWLGGYGVRPVRNGTAPSSHGFGAAFDWRIEESTTRAALMSWLTTNYAALGVQAVHDYVGCRIWHAGRYPDQGVNTWWRPQVASPATGMGQPWAKWLHIETSRDRWADATPIPARPGVGSNPTPPPDTGVLFHPERGIWGLWPLTGNKPTLRQVSEPVPPFTADATRYLQGVLRLKSSQPVAVDGDYGPRTLTAVLNLQRFFGLKADGIVGPKTWAVVDLLAGR